MTVGEATWQRLDVPGGAVGFTDRGAGEPLLLVHAGVFAAWHGPLAGQRELDGCRVIDMVRAGYDPTSPAPRGHVTIADHAAHCAAVLHHLGIGRARLVGHSSGALVALQLALDHPELVHGLVLVEPAAVTALVPAAAAEDIRRFLMSMAEAAVAGADLGALFDRFMREVCAQDYRDVVTAALGADGLARASRDCGFFFRDEIPACVEWTFADADAARITQPVLLVRGGDSPPLVEAVGEDLAARLPNARTRQVDGTDHLLPLRHPKALARLVAEFVDAPA